MTSSHDGGLRVGALLTPRVCLFVCVWCLCAHTAQTEAIDMAWELCTKVWKIDGSRLYATYFEGDDGIPADMEAKAAWLKYLPADHVISANKKVTLSLWAAAAWGRRRWVWGVGVVPIVAKRNTTRVCLFACIFVCMHKFAGSSHTCVCVWRGLCVSG